MICGTISLFEAQKFAFWQFKRANLIFYTTLLYFFVKGCLRNAQHFGGDQLISEATYSDKFVFSSLF